MNQYKFYRTSNYIVISDNISEETFYGFVKEVQVDKSNANKASYRVFNVKDFDNTIPLVITQILKEDGSPYTESEFDTFYTQNTGNFNGGGSAPGVQSVTGTAVDNTDPQNPVINSTGGSQDLQQTLDNGNISQDKDIILTENTEDFDGYQSQLSRGFLKLSYPQADNRGVRYGLDQITFYNPNDEFRGSLSWGTGRFIFPEKDPDNQYFIALREDFTPDITIVNNGDHTIPDGVRTRIITLTDNTPQIVTLPAIADSVGSIYFITNDSTSTVDINSKTGSNDIWDGGLTFSTKMATAGTPVRIINDGLNYKVL